MFIRTVETPNPATLKFLPGRDVAGQGNPTRDIQRGEDVSAAPLAKTLFNLPHITRVFFGSDYISITKSVAVPWEDLKPSVLSALMGFYEEGHDALLEDVRAKEVHVYEGDTALVVEQIKELIDLRVRPAVAEDGGDIVFQHFDDGTGTVFLEMKGACAGCPSSSLTLKSGVENLLKHYVPEVNSVEQTV